MLRPALHETGRGVRGVARITSDIDAMGQSLVNRRKEPFELLLAGGRHLGLANLSNIALKLSRPMLVT